MVMIRNPWGKTYYKGPWSKDDAKWNKSFYKKQVPHGVDPQTAHAKGVFITNIDIVKASKNCFNWISITHLKDKNGYKRHWYDQDNLAESNTRQSYTVVPKSNADDLYIMAEQYFRHVVPYNCLKIEDG